MEKKNKTMRTLFLRVSEVNHIANGDEIKYDREDILNTIDNWLKTKKFEYFVIEHINEDGSNKHWHIVISFPNKSSATFNTVKKKFPYGDIETCRSGVKNCVRYIVHIDKPEKKQYKWEDIITNAPNKLEMYKIPGKTSINVETKIITDKIVKGEIKEYEIEKIPTEIYTQKHSQIISAFELRRKKLLKDPTRNVDIIVLMGKTRLGKSTYARVWAEKYNKSIFFSSGGKDFFGEYLGQDVAVLDDFDHGNVTINDFKKIIDPYINGTVPSRYHNKLFVGDTIFICTNQSITDWFPYDDDADRAAVFERISIVLDFKSYDELSVSSELSVFDDFKIPKYSEGTSYYTINDLVLTDSYKEVQDKRGYTVNRYREWGLQPVDRVINEFDLKKHINVNVHKTRNEDFLKQFNDI